MKLREVLARRPFAVSMSCSFFGYFAHSGALVALEEAGLLPSTGVSGSSSGAVVAAMLAAGYKPTEMEALFQRLNFGDVFAFRPRFYWGFPGFAMFEQRLDEIEATVLDGKPKRLEDCSMPVALSIYDATAKRGRVLRSGRIASAVAASAAVPVMMHAVKDEEDGHLLLDGGVSGDMLGTNGAPDTALLVVNLFVRAFLPDTPPLPDAVVVDMYGVPFVTPATLRTAGPRAHRAAYRAMKCALDSEVPDAPDTPGDAKRFAVRAPASADGENDDDLCPRQNGVRSQQPPPDSCAPPDSSSSGTKAPSWFDLWRS